MGKWSKSLPEPIGCEPSRSDRAASALDEIADAMAYADGERTWALDHVRQAAAEVRAWRKSLDGWSVRWDATGTGSVRSCLRWAARCVLWADEGSNLIRTREEYLRRAEGELREAARLLDKEQA